MYTHKYFNSWQKLHTSLTISGLHHHENEHEMESFWCSEGSSQETMGTHLLLNIALKDNYFIMYLGNAMYQVCFAKGIVMDDTCSNPISIEKSYLLCSFETF